MARKDGADSRMLLNKLIDDITRKHASQPDGAANVLMSRLINSKDPALILELVGEKLLKQLCIQAVHERMKATGTGVRAAAGKAGHRGVGYQQGHARLPATPHMNQPPRPTGGGQKENAFPGAPASPGSAVAAEAIYVTDHFRGRPYSGGLGPNQPAVPADVKGRIAIKAAQNHLEKVRCGDTPLKDMTAYEALTWVERQRKRSEDIIQKSKEIIGTHTTILSYHVRMAEYFAHGLPPGQKVGEFYDNHPDVYQDRVNKLHDASQSEVEYVG